jgi:hypothetical protein
VALQLVCLGAIAGSPTTVLRSLIYARGAGRQAITLAAVTLGLLLVSFPALAAAAGVAGAGLAFAITAYVSLLMHVWVTRSTVAFPWRSIARALAAVGTAALAAWAVSEGVPGLPGLVASGALYLGVLALLAWTFERPLFTRVYATAMGRFIPSA